MRKSIPSVLVAAVIAATAGGTALVLPRTSPAAVPEQNPTARQSAPGPTPTPHVMDFAKGLKTPPKKLPATAEPVPLPADLDGCDHGYGTAGQCVPVVFPPGVGDSTEERCDWLKKHGFKELKVHDKVKPAEKDKLKLDKNKDGVACGRGD